MIGMVFGYLGLVFLAMSLIIGPWNTLCSRSNPLSINLRRDIGIWTGIFSIVHVITGLQVHMNGKFWLYFIFPLDEARLLPIRYDPFGIANYMGLAATLLVIVLLAVSNNFSMRKLRAKLWKRIQRSNYAFGQGID